MFISNALVSIVTVLPLSEVAPGSIYVVPRLTYCGSVPDNVITRSSTMTVLVLTPVIPFEPVAL